MENKNIIVILIAIIIVLTVIAGAMYLQLANAKEPTKIKITSNKTLYKGDELTLKLADFNKTPLKKQNINITITKKGKVVMNKTIKTDFKGKAKMKLDLKKGKYTVNAIFAGNENHAGNNTTQKLTIKEEFKQDTSQESSSDKFAGATWQKRTQWDDGTPVNGDLYLITTSDGDYWTYDNGVYYHGVDRFI